MRWIALLFLPAVLLLAACEEEEAQPTTAPTTAEVVTATPELQAPTESPPPPPEPTATVGEETITVGETVAGIPKGYDPAPFSMTLLSCMESEIVVDGPYIDGYYTFTAQPGMRFVILQYRLMNDGVRQADTPYINTGEVLTAPDGYFYKIWSPPVGVHSEEYAPRPSTQEELDILLGDTGGFETLLPEESIMGRVVFEIPTDAEPVEATLAYIPAKVQLEGLCRR